MQHFDVLIIGAGQAAIPLSWELAKAGKSVAIAERKHLGGSCINFGCTPTKAAIASSTLAYDARRAGEFGLHLAGLETHYAAVLTRARGIKEEAREGLEEGFRFGDNAPKILRGHARLFGRGDRGYLVEISEEQFSAAVVILDTGVRTKFPAVPGLTEVNTLHAGNWLDHPELPGKMAMLGGGVIAVEMSQFYRRMGCDVTILESASRILPREDDDVVAGLERQFRAEKIRIETGVQITSVEPHGSGLKVAFGGESESFDSLFVAAGRTPNTDQLGLETVGVEVDRKGIVVVDEKLETTARGIYAVGDIRGGPQFTHTSWDDFRIMKSQLLGDGKRTLDRIVPYAIFTDPAIGRVGMSEREAMQSGRIVKVGRYDMTHNGLARERRNRAGFVKVFVDGDTHEVLGGAILAREAGEMIELLAAMMALKADYRVIRDAVVAHPTYMEAVQSALEAIA